jgi:hypothetical protein
MHFSRADKANVAPISELPALVDERNRLREFTNRLPEENKDLVQHRRRNPFGKEKNI